MALFYLDASAVVKLVQEEPESPALSAYLEGADLISSELIVAEIPRAIRRAVADDPSLSLAPLLEQTGDVLDAISTAPVDQSVLVGAGELAEPALRALDAIHVSSALALSPIDAFVSYDERQSAAARLCGLRTVMPTSQPQDAQPAEPPDEQTRNPTGS